MPAGATETALVEVGAGAAARGTGVVPGAVAGAGFRHARIGATAAGLVAGSAHTLSRTKAPGIPLAVGVARPGLVSAISA